MSAKLPQCLPLLVEKALLLHWVECSKPQSIRTSLVTLPAAIPSSWSTAQTELEEGWGWGLGTTDNKDRNQDPGWELKFREGAEGTDQNHQDGKRDCVWGTGKMLIWLKPSMLREGWRDAGRLGECRRSLEVTSPAQSLPQGPTLSRSSREVREKPSFLHFLILQWEAWERSTRKLREMFCTLV